MADMAFSLFTPERRTATCSICGHAARPGAKLCPQCKAALKRVRHETVSQLEPLSRKPSAANRHAERKPRARPAAGREPAIVPPRRRRLPSILVVLGIAVAALGVAATMARHDAGVMAPLHDVNLAVPPTAPTVSTVAAPPVSPSSLPAPPEASVKVSAPAEVRAAAPAASAGRIAPRAPPPIVSGDSIAAFGPVAEPPAPAPAIAPPPPPREAPPPDRWQQLAESMATCGGEAFIGRVVCEQRARLSACDGYWGQVPQCQTVNRNDYGQ
jgi:hypothetical protein